MREDKSGYIYYDYHKKSEKEEIRETAWTSVFRWLYALIGILTAIFVVLIFFFRVFAVSGRSMTPTFNSGDILLVSSVEYEPERGDIIVIASDLEGGDTIIKRVIATSQQTVNVDYDTGTVYVDGKPIEEKYLKEKMTQGEENEIEYPYTVPKGSVFVMGDNRNDSADSRTKELGCVDEKFILGKVIISLRPFNTQIG